MKNDEERVFMDGILYAMEGKDPSQAILDQEKRGQQEVVKFELLPKKMNDNSVPREILYKDITNDMEYKEQFKIQDMNNIKYTKEMYEKVGIEIICENDDLFYQVKLPEGWKVEATDHSMWNSVKDDKGRERISFFYKAAFYDRNAFSNFTKRYGYSVMPFDDYKSDIEFDERISKPWHGIITDCGKEIWKTEEVEPDDKYEYSRKLENILKEEINKRYPNWKDVFAYWDED